MRMARCIKNIKLGSIAETIIAFILTVLVLQTFFQANDNEFYIPQSILKWDDKSLPNKQMKAIKPMVYHERIIWEDKALEKEMKIQAGNGEHGTPAKLSSHENEMVKKYQKIHGFNAILSDDISLKRSLPDVRAEVCKKKAYFKNLPKVSIIIPIYNEYRSVLERTITSIVRRTPPQLIKEIILVDDFSSSEFIAKKLQNFLDTEFQKTKFKIIRLPVRVGPIVAKNTGAKAASGDALVFLDSQVEVTTNWLPPLLNGLVENYKMVTCPIIDNIDPNTFQYIVEDYGNSRLLFDWKFSLKRFPLTGHGSDFITDGHQSPITLGMFAITKKFFQEIEGFDPGLKMYGGENFEISFKTWQCGGEIIELPCSRVGHINRIDGQRDKYNETLAHNLKRVAEVWLDDYKDVLYNENLDMFNKTRIGDISKQLELRKKLKCKPFKWYLDKKVPDLLELFPAERKLEFASGALQLFTDQKYCITLEQVNSTFQLGLGKCPQNLIEPPQEFHFELTWNRDLRLYSSHICVDLTMENSKDNTLTLEHCQNGKTNQMWRFLPKTGQLKLVNPQLCLQTDDNRSRVFAGTCNFSANQKWNFGYQNMKSLENWERAGVKIKS